MNQVRSMRTVDDQSEISVLDLLAWVRAGWRVIPITLLLSLALVVGYLHMKAPYYSVEMLVSPASNFKNPGSSSPLGAYAASFGLGSTFQSNPDFLVFIEILTSETTARKIFDSRPDIVRKIFAADWDSEHQVWRRHGGFTADLANWLKRRLSGRSWVPPGPEDLRKYIKGEVQITTLSKSPIVSLRMESPDPETAMVLISQMCVEAEALLRDGARESNQRQLKYLQERLQTVNALDYRQAIITLIADAERQLMLISNDIPYVVRVVELPEIPNRPDGPVVGASLAVAFVVGCLSGVALAVPVGIFLTRRRRAKEL